MRLRDLDARFVDDVSATGSHMMQEHDRVDGAQGIMFRCPRCADGKPIESDSERPGRRYVVGAHYIEVLFANPRGVAAAPTDAGVGNGSGGRPRWQIESGSTFDDLTLTPSINCDIPWKDEHGVEHESGCKFHGYIRNGDAA